MHQNASECVQNEMCKCFVHENIKKWVYIAFKGAKISKILATLCDGRPCRHIKRKILLASLFILFSRFVGNFALIIGCYLKSIMKTKIIGEYFLYLLLEHQTPNPFRVK